MKRFLFLLTAFALLLSLCACGNAGNPSDNSFNAASSQDVGTENSVGFDSIGDVEVDAGLFSVTLTIPADFVDEEMTQEQLDLTASENGYKSATLNEDGSVTYVMTKTQHNEMMAGIRQEINETLSGMVGSDDYPGIVSIEANDDYTKYTVTMSTDEVSLEVSFAVIGFYIYSGMYHVFNGTEPGNINVQFVSESTGEIIQESNSDDMG